MENTPSPIPQEAPHPFVSIIIPTYKDSERLVHCIAALIGQSYPHDRYEIIVINNDPTSSLPAEIHTHPQVKVQREVRQGSYAARNRGIQVAKGHILAFTDADCIPARDWLEAGANALTHSQTNVHLVAGKIEISTPSPRYCTAFELYERVHAFDQKQYVQRDHYGVTANLFVYRTVFESVGLFSEELQSGGDFEWGRRATGQGHILAYDGRVTISHPARKSWQEMLNKTQRIMRGHYHLMGKNLYPRSRFILAMIADLLFPYRSVPNIISTRKINGFSIKVKAAIASIIIRYMRAFYRFKLALGS